jgi:hypothetical protein
MNSPRKFALTLFLSSALGGYAANAAYNIAGYAAIETKLFPKEVQLVELSIKELNQIAGDLTVDDSDDVTLEQLAQEIDEYLYQKNSESVLQEILTGNTSSQISHLVTPRRT